MRGSGLKSPKRRSKPCATPRACCTKVVHLCPEARSPTMCNTPLFLLVLLEDGWQKRSTTLKSALTQVKYIWGEMYACQNLGQTRYHRAKQYLGQLRANLLCPSFDSRILGSSLSPPPARPARVHRAGRSNVGTWRSRPSTRAATPALGRALYRFRLIP